MMGDHECLVCGDFLDDVFKLDCGHEFHSYCVETLLKRPDPKCRACKLPIQSNDVNKLRNKCLQDCREISAEQLSKVALLSEKRPDLLFFRPVFQGQKFFMTYEMNVKREKCVRLEQFVAIVSINANQVYKIDRVLNWQKQRGNNDCSRMLSIAVSGCSVYCSVRYSDDSYGVEKVDPDSLQMIEKLKLKDIKFDPSTHGRLDASILGVGKRLLILQKKTSTKTVVLICENGKLVAEREINRTEKGAKPQQQSITRICGDFLLMIDRNKSALAIIQWKKGDEILDEFKVMEFEIPEKRPIKSFAMCLIESVPHIVLLNDGSKNALKVYQIVETDENVQIVYKQQIVIKEAKNMVCVFSTPQDGQILTMDCVNLCCYGLNVKKESPPKAEPFNKSENPAAQSKEATVIDPGQLYARFLAMDKEFQTLESKCEELKPVISIGYRPMIKRCLNALNNIPGKDVAFAATNENSVDRPLLVKLRHAVNQTEDVCGFLRFHLPMTTQPCHGVPQAITLEKKPLLSKKQIDHVKKAIEQISQLISQ